MVSEAQSPSQIVLSHHVAVGTTWPWLALILVWTSAQFFILGKYSLTLTGDELDSVFSALMGASFADDSGSYWYRFAASGTDQMAMGYTPDIDRLLVNVLPGWLAYQVRHVGQNSAFVLGVYFLARRVIGMERSGALFAAFAAGCWIGLSNIYMSAVAFLPLLLLSLSCLVRQPGKATYWAVTFAATVLYSATAHIQFLVGFPFLIIGVWFVLVVPCRHLLQWLVIVVISVVALALRAQDIWSLYLNAPFSQRANWVHYKLGFWDSLQQGAERVLSSLNPFNMFNFYKIDHSLTGVQLNSLPLFFFIGLVGVAVLFRSDKRLRIVLFLVLSLALLDAVLPVFKYLVYDIVPPIRGFSINKLWLMSSFSVLILSGYGYLAYSRWVEETCRSFKKPRWRRAVLVVPIALIVVLHSTERTIFSAIEWVTQGNYVQVYESPIIKELATRIKDSGEPSRVSLYQMYDAYLQGYGLESAGGVVVMFSKRYSDFWSTLADPSKGIDPEIDYILESASQTMNLGMTFTVNDKMPERALNSRFRLNLLSLANVKYIISRDRLTDPSLVKTGFPFPDKPWSILTRKEKVISSLKANVNGRTHMFVYENTDALPRFFWAEDIAVYPDRRATLKAMAGMTAAEMKRVVPVSRDDLPDGVDPTTAYDATATLHIDDYRSDDIVLSVQTDASSLLVASQSYSPFWRCYIDGEPAPIIPAYTTFWAVEVPAGSKTVTFSYHPPNRL